MRCRGPDNEACEGVLKFGWSWIKHHVKYQSPYLVNQEGPGSRPTVDQDFVGDFRHGNIWKADKIKVQVEIIWKGPNGKLKEAVQSTPRPRT